nr:serine hydrolase domain-containing protein [Myxococcota bacterium]
TMRDILLHKNPWVWGHVEPIYAPRRVRSYSGGGYVVAEHVLELHISRSFKTFLKEEILDPAGMTKSSFDKAQTSMNDLARGCSRYTCAWDVKQTNVKAAGGLLATAKEYAQLVTIFLNGGVDEDGTEVIPFENIEKIMTPAMHEDSSKIPCTDAEAGNTRIDWREMCIGTTCFDLPYEEVCLLGMYRQPLYDVDSTEDYYSGLGVRMSTTLLDDGFPRDVYHAGAQDGFISNFRIDRKTGNGIVVMVNGNRSWIDGKGFERGSEAFASEIMQAWELVY